MKLNAKQKKIFKITVLSLLALLEVYLIYAAAASMYTYHQHPRFESANGQVAQSSGYRTQFYLCLVFTLVIPALSGMLVYLFWFKKPKTVAAVESALNIPANAEVASTVDAETEAGELSAADGNASSGQSTIESDELARPKPL